MLAEFDDQFLDLIPPDEEMQRIGPIYDRRTYFETGKLSRDHLLRYANLQPQHSVLDVGCGFGRVAIHLLPLLDSQARYLGFDVVRSEIDWCRQRIAPRNSGFSFEHLDVRNDRYNPTGSLSADAIKFPVPQGQKFDLVFLFSVFTHMLPGAVSAYLREAFRHLRPGGTLFASFFLINGESRRLMDAGGGVNSASCSSAAATMCRTSWCRKPRLLTTRIRSGA